MDFITSNWIIIPDPPYCFGYAVFKDKFGQKLVSPAVGVGTDRYNEPPCAGLSSCPPPNSILIFLQDIGSIFYLK